MSDYTDDLTRDLRTLVPSDKAHAIAAEVDRIAKERDDLAEAARPRSTDRTETATEITDEGADHATHSLGARIRDLHTLTDSKKEALAQAADSLQRRHDAAVRQFGEAEAARLTAEAFVWTVRRAVENLSGVRPGTPLAKVQAALRTLDSDDQTIDDFEPGRWWIVQAPDGSTWAETSVEREARSAVRPGDTLLRQFVSVRRTEYRAVEGPAKAQAPKD